SVPALRALRRQHGDVPAGERRTAPHGAGAEPGPGERSAERDAALRGGLVPARAGLRVPGAAVPRRPRAAGAACRGERLALAASARQPLAAPSEPRRRLRPDSALPQTSRAVPPRALERGPARAQACARAAAPRTPGRLG